MRKKGIAILTVLTVVLQCIFGVSFGDSISNPFVTVAEAADFNNAITAEVAGLTAISASVMLNGNELQANDKVKTGDKLALDFQWEITSNFTNTDTIIRYDFTDKLYGIKLSDKVIPVFDDIGHEIARYTVQGSYLYIELFTGFSGRKGNCSLDGIIDLTNVGASDTGKFTLKFINPLFDVIADELIPGLQVNKTAVGDAYYKNGELYQDFKIEVKSRNQTSTDVTLNDVMGAYYLAIENAELDGTAISPAPAVVNFSLALGDIAVGTTKTITYTAKLDTVNAIANNNNWQFDDERKNTAIATSGTKTVTSTAYYNYSAPTVNKTGVLNGNQIDWTIIVDPNCLGTNTDFSVTDTIDNGLGNIVSINKSAFQLDGDVYKYTYSTDISSLQASMFSTTVKNKADVTFSGNATVYSSTGSVTIPGTSSDLTEKSYTKNGDNTITWTVEYKIPNDSSINKIELRDTLYGNAYHDYVEYMTGTNPQVSRMDSAVSMNSFSLSIEGGSSYTWEQIATNLNAYQQNSDRDFYIRITDSNTIPSLRGKTITVTYNTTTNDESVLRVSNVSTIDLYNASGQARDTDEAIYNNPNLIVSKLSNSAYNYGGAPSWRNKPNGWAIYISTADFTSNNTITVSDTIPEGLSYVANSALLDVIEVGNIYNQNSTGVNSCLSTNVSGNVVTFTINVNDTLRNKISQLGINTLRINYITDMSDENYAKLVLEGGKDYTNSAVVTYGTKNKTCSATLSLAADKEKVLDKVCHTQTADDAKDIANGRIIAKYTINVNFEKVQLNGGSDFDVTDILGTNLTLLPETVKIYEDGWSEIANPASMYTVNDNEIKFTLKDKTYYKIDYTVKVIPIQLGATDTDEQKKAKFANTVETTLSGSYDFSVEEMLESQVYQSQGGYVYDEALDSITISGTKTWRNDAKNPGARPSKITIALECVKTDAFGTVYPATVKTFMVNAPADDNGNWSYTISNLMTKDVNGNEYTYNVKEVLVDGYKVSYTGNTNGLNGDEDSYTIGITNYFDAVEKEVGSLKVIKNWVGDTYSDRPYSVTFNLADSSGEYTFTKTLYSSDEAIVFDNLPLYTYSRSADNKLVRTPRTYTLEEISVTGYTSSLATPYEFTLLETPLTPYTELTGAVEVVVTNTKTSNTPNIPNIPSNPNVPSTPSTPTNPSNPSNPTNPSNPSNPTNPSEPSNPTNPSDPSNPDDPSNPSDTTDPSEPSDPDDPSNPSDTTDPSEPSDPDNPSNPSDTANPSKPSNPDESGKPSDPDEPSDSDELIESEEEDEPDEPDEPEFEDETPPDEGELLPPEIDTDTGTDGNPGTSVASVGGIMLIAAGALAVASISAKKKSK